jgi:transposase
LHGRRKFFDLARLTKAPIAAERSSGSMSCSPSNVRSAVLLPRGAGTVARSLIVELEAWLREQRAKLARNNDTTKAINCCLSRWDVFSRFLDDGRLAVEQRCRA